MWLCRDIRTHCPVFSIAKFRDIAIGSAFYGFVFTYIYIYIYIFQSNLKITVNMYELKKLGGKVLQLNLQAKTYARGSSDTWHNVARKKRTISDHFNFPRCVSKQEGKGSFTDAFVLTCSDLQLLSKGIELLPTATGPYFGLSVFL